MENKGVYWRVDLAVFVVLAVFCTIAYALGKAVTPFILAGAFAYLLNPAVNRLTRRGVPRGVSVGLFLAAFFLAVFALVLFFAYVLRLEIPQLINNLPGYAATLDREYLPRIKQYFGLGEEINLDYLARGLRDKLLHLSPESISSAAGYVLTLVSGTLDVFMAALNLFLIPVLMAYFLIDFERMKSAFLDSLPRGYSDIIVKKLAEVEAVLRDFAKGQLMVAVIMGVLYSIGLWAAGVDMPILVGMCSGVLNLVPYLGTTVGILGSVVLVLLKYHDLVHPVSVLAVFAIVQTIEGYVITPRVVGERLGLHPAVIILALVVFGHLLGFVGILLAVPIAAVLKVFISGFVRDYKTSRFYTGES